MSNPLQNLDPGTTGAPGSTNGVQNFLDPTGDPTTEVYPVAADDAHDDASMASGLAYNVGPHGGVEAAQTQNSFGDSVPTDTGAHSGTPTYQRP